MKKFLLMACIAISMLGFSAYAVDTWNGTADTDWSKDANGNYLIYTAEELAGLAKVVNEGKAVYQLSTEYHYSYGKGMTFLLMDDIDLSGHDWIPIGFLSKDNKTSTNRTKKMFCGTFDGQGHTISHCNVNLNNSTSNCNGTSRKVTAGLFGYINGATIKNLAVTNSTIYLESNCWNNYAGAICGWMDGNSTITQCSAVNNSITSYSPWELWGVNYGNANAGGICGSAENSTATGCTVAGNDLSAEGSKSESSANVSNNDSGSNVADSNNNVPSDPNQSVEEQLQELKNKTAETNRPNLISNSWGNPATAHKYIDETTGMTTDIVYYAFEGVSNSMAGDGYRSDATISYDGAKGAKIDNFEYNGKTYTLYPQGAKLNVTFNLKGWSADEKNTGWKVTQVYDSNASYPAQLNPVWKSDTKSAAVNAATGRYDRAEVYEITVPAQKFGILYETKNNSDEWAATNLSTFIWNNDLAQGGMAVEPTSPYYINETTGEVTNHIYYAVEVDNTKATNGSVENVTIAGANERVFVVNGKEYTAYPQGTQLTATFTLNGWVKDENSGYFVKAIEGIEAQRTALSVDENNAKRTEVYTMVVPGNYTELSYTTHNPRDVNRATILYNNFGEGKKPSSPYYIDETTGIATDRVYYTVAVDDTKAAEGSVRTAATISGDNAMPFEHNEKSYTLYPAGTELTATFSLNGWSKDEKNTGYFVKAVEGVEAQIIPAEDTKGELQEGRYLRTEAYKFTMPAQATTVAYTTHNKSNEWAATNRATILYNNFGEGTKPASSNYINETTGEETDFIYYTIEINDAKATEGSVRAAATISGDNAMPFEHNEKSYTLYPAGTELTATFSLNGWSEDEKNTGYFVKEVEGVEAQIIPADDTKGELKEGRYLRTEAYKFTMPAQATTVAYTTYNKSNEWAATNMENFISNSWGNPATAHQYINETTGIATNLVYYAFEGISDADAEGVTEAATISYEGEDAKTIQYNDNTYTLYPAGAKLTATFNLQGWSEDEKNTGWSVSEVYGSNEAVLSYDKISDTKSDDVNAETGRYDRAEVYEITVPAHKFDILYKTTNNSNEWAATNRATILYNNFGEGTEPESPYYIDETTGIATDYIYYMYEGITDELASIGSVRQGATVEHSEYKMEFVKDETTYTLYPAGYPSVTATFYLEGFTGDWSNVGYYIESITNQNTEEIVEAGLVEIYDDYETHNEFTNRFMRKFVYNITMPESPLALAYTTIMEQPTDVEDVTAEALQVYGVNGALVVKAAAPAQLVVVTVDGRVAYSGMVEGNTRIALPAGMYIANNHKVIVR